MNKRLGGYHIKYNSIFSNCAFQRKYYNFLTERNKHMVHTSSKFSHSSHKTTVVRESNERQIDIIVSNYRINPKVNDHRNKLEKIVRVFSIYISETNLFKFMLKMT